MNIFSKIAARARTAMLREPVREYSPMMYAYGLTSRYYYHRKNTRAKYKLYYVDNMKFSVN